MNSRAAKLSSMIRTCSMSRRSVALSSLTRAPRWASDVISPSVSRMRMASRSGERLTPRRETSSRSRMRSPGLSRPAMIASRSASTTRSRMRPGSVNGCAGVCVLAQGWSIVYQR